MLINVTDQSKIKLLLEKASQDSTKINRLVIDFDPSVDISEFIIEEIKSDSWPLAVDPLLIANDTVEDRISRAEIVLTLIPPLEGKTFLDFGCAEGSIPIVAANTAKLSVGFDINTTGWDTVAPKDNLSLISDITQLKGPFDIILAFDVLDHLEAQNQVEILTKLRTLLSDQGRIYVRFHPWTSKHANHCYRTFNKAFCHMFLSNEKLKELGHNPLPVFKTTSPIITYEQWIKTAGLRVLSREIHKDAISDYFKQPQWAAIIKSHWKTSNIKPLASGNEFPTFQTEFEFIDYVLSV